MVPSPWLAGFLGGGLAGYLFYEWRGEVSGLLKAWQAASNWQPDRAWWRVYYAAMMGMTRFSLMLFVGLISIAIWIANVRLGDVFALLVMMLPGCILAGLFCGIVMFRGYTEDELRREASLFRNLASGLLLFCFCILPKFLFWVIPKSVLKALVMAIPRLSVVQATLKRGADVLGRFGKVLFKIVHSDLRLVCGIDAAIGAAVGHFVGSAFLGALAGGFLGILNYEAFCIRLFHLVPEVQSLSSRR
jgi:hypothetical protein